MNAAVSKCIAVFLACKHLNLCDCTLQVSDNIKVLESDFKDMKHMQAIATAGIVTLCDSLEKIVGQSRNGQASVGMLRQYLSWFRQRNPLQGEEIAHQLPVSSTFCSVLERCCPPQYLEDLFGKSIYSF